MPPVVNLAELLTLERPLAVLDLETTGFDINGDRIIQIGLTMHYPKRDPIPWVSLINPQRPIDPKSMEVHHITDEMVAASPTFEQVAPVLAPKITNVDIMGYNVTFDINFLQAQMRRVGVRWDWKGHTICASELWRKMSKRTLSDAYKEFGGEGGRPLPDDHPELEGAHDAGRDVLTTEIVLRGQLTRWRDKLPKTVKELQDICFPDKENWIDSKGKFIFVDGVPCIAFGKHFKDNGNKPVPMQKIDRGYYKFITDKDFEPELKEIAGAALLGSYPVQQPKPGA